MLRIRREYLPAAIEIGYNSLKLLQLGKFKSSYKIVKADYLALDSDKSATPSNLKESLKKLVKKNQLKGEVVTSVPLNKMNINTYVLPDMPANEIEAALFWKIKQNLTPDVSFEDIFFDYVWSSPQKNEDKKNYALVFTIAKKIILDLTKLYKELSLNLVSVEPQPYAIIEGLSLIENISKEETVLVLQLGANNSSVAVVSSGCPYLIMPLNVSGNGFTEALVSYYQFDWEKAEAFKLKEGLGELQLKEAQNSNEAGCFPALSSQLENLIIDIEDAFKYFSGQLIKFKAPVIDRLILCGGAAALINLDKFLSSKLNLPVSVFDPGDFMVAHSEDKVRPMVRDHSLAFASALGLATKFINGGLGIEIKAS